jgi:very-short-patch-repair endonuclease
MRQCCSKECSEKVRIDRARATKERPEVKEKIRAGRIEKFGAWVSENQGAEIAARRRAKNGGDYASAETRERLRAGQLNSGRTTEDRRVARLLVNEAEVAAKSRETREARYGTWTPDSAIKKAAQTKIQRYGAAMPPEFVSSRKATMMGRYGVEHALQIPAVATKASSSYDRKARGVLQGVSNLAKYGVHNPMMVPEIAARSLATRNAGKRPVYAEMTTTEWWDVNYKDAKESLEGLAVKFQVSTSHLGLTAKSLGYAITNPLSSSLIERRFASAIATLGAVVVQNTKKVVPPQEIDIFLPEHALAIEVNGLYWHSEEAGGKHKDYHADKMKRCESQGIRLLQFWDSELTDNFDLCVAMVKSIIGGNEEKIGARECTVVEVSSQDARAFMDANHLAGFRPGNHIGLANKGGELVAVATYAGSFFRKGFVELVRFASRQGVTVTGGFTKLVNKIQGPLVSYSDNRYSRGGVYSASGFELVRDGTPTPWYTKDGARLHHRTSIAKKVHADMTQRESAKKEGWLTVWDAGQRTWLLSHK